MPVKKADSLLFLISIVLVLAASEVAVRFFVPRYLWDLRDPAAAWMADDRLGWVNRPLLDIPFRDREGKVLVAFSSPVFDAENRTVAALTILVDPTLGFTEITRTGRIGATGESYAVDDRGYLLTGSRFDRQLQEIGLLG